MDQPSIGRIVHYMSYGTPGGEYSSVCRAAIITDIFPVPADTEPVWLCVLNPSGLFFNECNHDEETKLGGTWHWPERV